MGYLKYQKDMSTSFKANLYLFLIIVHNESLVIKRMNDVENKLLIIRNTIKNVSVVLFKIIYENFSNSKLMLFVIILTLK